ncbi:MAG TPA: GMC family oxidoreductase N-terminal domain-containing protein, partial [Acetobacteraceae bacterium]|nr:GMC family oxidoreductase N-terminal domain-containing protein [Acetobacteraceae bacterium]
MDQPDYLVIGGGTAGCIVASRLSEDPAVRVTLLEAGPEDRDPWIHIPAGYARLFASGKYDWKFATEPEPELGGRCIAWPRGRVLGGSGSINGLVFLRGSPHDYDRWAQAGARGWSHEDVLPVFRRIEHWTGTPHANRGTGGPITVSEPRTLSPGAAAFIEAAAACGIPRHRDINADAIEGVAPIQMNVRAGFRRSTARAYLQPARKRPNLRVLTGVTVSKLLIEDGRAVGCVGRRERGTEETFRARETIVCAGAIASPKLLLLSGIGDGAALQALGIPVLLDRPAVGQNLQDHFIVRFIFRTCPAGTLNELTATRLRMAAMALGYALRRSGPMAVGATEATLFARVTPGAEEAEVQFQFINFSLTPGMGYVLPKHPGFMFNFGQCRPESRGALTLRSADPDDKPVIRANYLSDPRDQHVMLEASRLASRLGQTRPFADLVEEQSLPTPGIDDAAMLDYIRQTGTTVYHPCGTCRMGADEAAVVDPQLRVRGIEGLRIADASVMPLVPSSNIQPAVMMVAERAADFIRARKLAA